MKSEPTRPGIYARRSRCTRGSRTSRLHARLAPAEEGVDRDGLDRRREGCHRKGRRRARRMRVSPLDSPHEDAWITRESESQWAKSDTRKQKLTRRGGGARPPVNRVDCDNRRGRPLHVLGGKREPCTNRESTLSTSSRREGREPGSERESDSRRGLEMYADICRLGCREQTWTDRKGDRLHRRRGGCHPLCDPNCCGLCNHVKPRNV